MDDLYYIIKVLEASVEKNGEQPLTNKWLLNIMNLAHKMRGEDEDKMNVEFDPHWD